MVKKICNFNLLHAKYLLKIAEVKLSSCGLEVADLKKNCDCGITELRLRSKILIKVAELLLRKCFLQVAELRLRTQKSCTCPPLPIHCQGAPAKQLRIHSFHYEMTLTRALAYQIVLSTGLLCINWSLLVTLAFQLLSLRSNSYSPVHARSNLYSVVSARSHSHSAINCQQPFVFSCSLPRANCIQLFTTKSYLYSAVHFQDPFAFSC
jgi:hypothetical protein